MILRTLVLLLNLFFLIPHSHARLCGVVSLKGLDKTTGRVHDLQIPVGETMRFGTLDITPHYCTQSPDEVIPETIVFLEIKETKGTVPHLLFSSWMFASNPGVSALEHPVYDVWVEPRRLY